MSYVTAENTTGLGIKKMSASAKPDPSIKRGQELAILVDVSSCTGCKACENACIAWHHLNPPITPVKDMVKAGFSFQSAPDLAPNMFMLMNYREGVTEKGVTWFLTKRQCMHCAKPGCLEACPSPGAIVQYANGVVDFDHSKCIGCRFCHAGCPFGIPRYDANHHPFKCNFCLDRVANGMEPACAKTCTTNALHFGTRTDMLDRGKKIVDRLKERGFDKALLYNPEGVGGTGYIYVLPHGDQLSQYAELPAHPSLSLLIQLWKGPLKYLGGLALLASAAAMAAHYIAVGPKTVEAHEKKEE